MHDFVSTRMAKDKQIKKLENELGEMKRELKDVKNRAEEVTRVVRQERDELAEQLRRRELDDENARNAGADSKLRTTVREMKQIEELGWCKELDTPRSFLTGHTSHFVFLT